MLTARLQLSKYPSISNIEKQTSIPKAYGAIGLAALYTLFIIFNLGGQLLTNFAGFVIPGYYSMAALFNTADKTADTQWLTVRAYMRLAISADLFELTWPQYWVVFSFFT